MGGALAGEVASKMAVETISERLLEDDPDRTLSPEALGDTLLERLYDAILFANQRIHREGRADPQLNGMGATFSGLGITSDGVDLIQVGDSRVYLIRNSRIYQLTKDQSLVQQLIDSQQISPEESETHPLKNVILQALGAQNEIFPAPARIEPRRGDVFLLCSDGLSNKVSAKDLLRIIVENENDLANACGALVTEANERGGEDNITVIIAKLSGDDLSEPEDSEIQLQTVNFGDIHDTADQG
jgi:protein phosphatase